MYYFGMNKTNTVFCSVAPSSIQSEAVTAGQMCVVSCYC